MKLPKWLCVLLHPTCKWGFVQNRYKDNGDFVGVYECKRCGDKSEGAPRNPLTGELK